MGRYAYEKFRMEFSADLQHRIAREIGMYYDIDEDGFDWTVIDLRVKRADMQQRYRLVDTIRKLEIYLQSLKAEPDYEEDDRIYITVSEAAQITGRNRKTIADWNRKGLLATGGSGKKKRLDVEETIEKLKKIVKISR